MVSFRVLYTIFNSKPPVTGRATVITVDNINMALAHKTKMCRGILERVLWVPWNPQNPFEELLTFMV